MLSIEEYTCNLIAGSKYITPIYFAVDRARDMENKDNRFQFFTKKIFIPNVGTKVYKSSELVELENLSFCKSVEQIIMEINVQLSLDQYIILLLKFRSTIRGLYQACCRARVSRNDAKTFCYAFVNNIGPYLTDVNKSKLIFRSSYEFISFYEKCEKNIFDSSLVFNNLY